MDNDYLNWIIAKVTDEYRNKYYYNLLSFLSTMDMICVMDRDYNFIENGKALRGDYTLETGRFLPPDTIYRPCSVLEYLVALAIAGEWIMCDDDYGDRTPQWFWLFIKNLGLCNMDDGRFEANKVMDKVSKWMNRHFEPNGKGNIVPGDGLEDARNVPFWVAFSRYLSRLIIM